MKWRAAEGIANGMLGAFVGRNAEISGYWAIGVLCRRALEGGEAIELDVLARRARPPWEALDELLARCHRRLLDHLRAARLGDHAITEARIRVSFEPTTRAHAASVRYRCVVTVVDARGTRVEQCGEGWCWPHDPAREQRSERVGLTLDPLGA
ncbi:MAG: hypothetical protein KDK70_38105 [Myxococcales bacterium]|nr:hypothetical protein [Myxococcales bacterium]